MALKQIDHGSKEYRQMVALRMEILRKTAWPYVYG